MPSLSNPKHELFAQALAKGKTQAEAYELAGYTPSEPNASRLTSNDKVQSRIAELQERGAKRAEVTIENLIDEAAEIQRSALLAGQHSAAVSALTAKAKLAGKWIERREVGEPGDFDGMTADELREHLRTEAKALGAGDVAAALAGRSGRAEGKPH